MNLHLPDDGHLAAHADDFLVPLDDVLARVRAAIPADAPIGTPFSVVVQAEQPLGRSRCVPTAGRRTWWGFRPGRSIPSHLAAGEPEDVSVITAWLCRDDADNATVTAVYPGLPAPYEIHDPDMPEAERPVSAAFWRDRALLAPEPRAIWLLDGFTLAKLGRDEGETQLRARPVLLEYARLLAEAAESAVGDEETAALFAGVLGREVARAGTPEVRDGDCLLVGRWAREPVQRRSEVSSNSKLLWYWVEVGGTAGNLAAPIDRTAMTRDRRGKPLAIEPTGPLPASSKAPNRSAE